MNPRFNMSSVIKMQSHSNFVAHESSLSKIPSLAPLRTFRSTSLAILLDEPGGLIPRCCRRTCLCVCSSCVIFKRSCFQNFVGVITILISLVVTLNVRLLSICRATEWNMESMETNIYYVIDTTHNV